MKLLLLLFIRLYWTIFSKSKRRKCLFRTSCSNYVYQTTKQEGFYRGLRALKYRFHNCCSGLQVFEDPISCNTIMILPNGQILEEDEIANRFITRH